MAMKIPQQSTFLYESIWTPEIDSLMLRTIIHMMRDLNWHGTVIPSHFFQEAAVAIEVEIGCRFMWNDLYDRLQFLEKRYRTFKDVVQVPGTFWDVCSNTVTAAEPVWKEIFKQKNEFAAAYFYRAEPEFQQLSILFGMNAVKPESETNVVVISDTTIPVEEPQGGNVLDAGDSEEVTSPNVAPATNVRRKLFEEDATLMDRESTNDRGHHFYQWGNAI